MGTMLPTPISAKRNVGLLCFREARKRGKNRTNRGYGHERRSGYECQRYKKLDSTLYVMLFLQVVNVNFRDSKLTRSSRKAVVRLP